MVRSKALWFLLTLIIIRLWLQPMPSSLWLDETGTAVILRGSFAEMWEKANRWIGQPAFYMALIWPFSRLPIQIELALRLTSLIGMAVASIFVYRIGRKVIGAESGQYACLIFAVIASYYAADARPYALGLMAATGAMLFLIRWMESGRWSDALAYSVFAALTVYFHFLFSVIFIAHALYILMRRARPVQVVAVSAFTATLLAPLVPAFLRLMKAGSGFTFIERPRLTSIVLDSFPASFYGFLVLGIAVVAVMLSGVEFNRPAISPEVRLFMLWAVVPVIGLFVASYATSVFLARYFAIALPGLALLVAWALGNLKPERAGRIIVLVLVLGIAIDRGGLHASVKHANDDWRAAMSAVRSITEREPLPMLVRSSFIESASPEHFHCTGQSEFLMAPQVIYSTPGIMLPLPINADGSAFGCLDYMLGAGKLGNKFLVIGSANNTDYQMWLRGRLGADFSDVDLGKFGTVSVDLFTRNLRGR